MTRGGPKEIRGFALVLTLSLIALLLMSVFALSQLTRLTGQISVANNYQVQATQNAKLGLAVAIGELQKLAGPDNRVTAMAGVAGATEGSQLRHWCGVWSDGGAFLGWLTSGASAGAASPSLGTSPIVTLVERKSVGLKPSSPSAYADEEYVDAGKIAITVPDQLGPNPSNGSYAFWVGDEGVKVSAQVDAAELPLNGYRVRVASTPTNVARMGQAYQDFDYVAAGRVIAYEQATNLFYANGSKLTLSNLRDSFHHVTVTHRSVASDGEIVVGLININTTSAVVWRSLLETFDVIPGITPFATATKRTLAINTVANGIAETNSGKSQYAPYLSVAAFLNSSFLESAITGTNGIAVGEFSAALAAMLAVRSDTFRVRAYGEAVNRVDPTKIEAVARCEAIVQRTTTSAPNGLGRRFVVTYFRWLGTDDI